MKVQFRALTEYRRPRLHIWNLKDDPPFWGSLVPAAGPDANGWWLFETELDPNLSIGFKLFEWDPALNRPERWESADQTFNRTIMLEPAETLPERVWLLHGSNRVLLEDPTVRQFRKVTLHMLTQKECRLYVWMPGKPAFDLEPEPETGSEDYASFVVNLENEWGNAFNFKFFQAGDGERQYESDCLNRTWSSADGDAIWTHSEAATILRTEPEHRQLVVHFQHLWGDVPVKMHLWPEKAFNSWVDFEGRTGADGWTVFQTASAKLYTGIPYRFKFFRPGADGRWEQEENPEASREVILQADVECWTLGGSSVLFSARPERNRQVVVEIIETAPGCQITNPDTLQVKVNQALVNLPPAFEKRPDGTWLFWTYPEIVTTFNFSANGQSEAVFHRIKPGQDGFKTYVVLGRPHCLFERPATGLFADPPYAITRPGVVEEEGMLRFALWAPYSRVRLEGQWQQAGPVDLQCKKDGAYWWWIQIPVNEVLDGLPAEFNRDYHGARYRFILNDTAGEQANTDLNCAKTVQDPAAAWVENVSLRGYSRLVNHRHYCWQSSAWKTPGWEYLMVYQLHPARLTNRNAKQPFGEIAHEIEWRYLKAMGITAILLMPSDEFPGSGWGYNPCFYYAAKDAYGGPDGLKRLVDVCHQNGIAVLLDVVFNHTCDNQESVLFDLDRITYIDGKTEWSSMINFDNQISRDFFAHCLRHWNQEYRIDGFRFDMTNVIVEGDDQNPKAYHVVEPNKGDGGWDFLHYLREKVKAVDPQCLMMAEQLPNNWGLSNYGGPMDTQWCDDFHDYLVMVRRGEPEMSRFADALKYSHTKCQQWYNVTNYCTSHDEVGNVNERMAYLPDYGRGFQINKVAAAATLLSRGIPMFFMGEESGESGQFYQDRGDPLLLNDYETDANRVRVRNWWKMLLELRSGNARIQGPAPIAVHYVDGPVIAFSRGDAQDYLIALNFGDRNVSQPLEVMNLPDGAYREIKNSTYPDYQVQGEEEFRNWDELQRGAWLNIPKNGAVILERVH